MEIPSRQQVIEEARERGERVAAVLPIHYPRALLRAYGISPVEVWGPPGVAPAAGNAHFQAYTCAIVRHATSLLLGPAARSVDLILIPHTCDALQGMGSVFKDFIKPEQPVVTLYHPRGRRASDRAFMVRELRRLAARLREITGREPTEADLVAAIETEEEATSLFAEVAGQRKAFALSDRELYTLLRSREYLPAERFIELARSVPRDGAPDGGVPLMMSGIVPEPMEIFDRINEMGARIVDDDLACCSRRIYRSTPKGDPFERLAAALLSMPPDPTVGSPIGERAAHIKARMQAAGARGLLVYDVKFCEPELFDLPLLRGALDKAGLRLLHVEYEMGAAVAQQTITRIEAFVEMLQ